MSTTQTLESEQHTSAPDSSRNSAPFLLSLRRYFAVIALLQLIREFAHMPLYTLWSTSTPGKIVFAAVHCTGGDILIAMGALLLCLLIVVDGWPKNRTAVQRVVELTLFMGVGYTVFSEWLNFVVRESWTYSELMPIVSVADAGLAFLLQRIVIPGLAFT